MDYSYFLNRTNKTCRAVNHCSVPARRYISHRALLLQSVADGWRLLCYELNSSMQYMYYIPIIIWLSIYLQLKRPIDKNDNITHLCLQKINGQMNTQIIYLFVFLNLLNYSPQIFITSTVTLCFIHSSSFREKSLRRKSTRSVLVST